MGNSTGSMFYMAAVLIAAYLVGMLLFTGFRSMKKWQEKWREKRHGRSRGWRRGR